MRFKIGVRLFLVFFAVYILACEEKTKPEPADPVARAELAVGETPSFENFINLGLAYANHDQRAEALKAYKHALEMSPKSPLAWNNVCAELNVQHREPEALGYCEKAVELEPDFAMAAQNLELTRAKIRTDKTRR